VASVFREGLAQLRFLLCGQIAGDEMSIHVFESALDLEVTPGTSALFLLTDHTVVGFTSSMNSS
jgi:hypothetical protein